MDTPSTVTLIHECPYRRVCSENMIRCETCAENPKRSYYRPINPYTNYPYTIIWGTGANYSSPSNGGTNAICHQESRR